MKSKHIIYPAVIFLLFFIPTTRYYVSIPGINDCMNNYVQQMKYSNYQGYVYNIEGLAHIEPANSNSKVSLEKFRVGKARGCLITGENLYSNFNNSVYCSVTYLIQNSPMHSSIKAPLAIYNGGEFSL